MPKATGPARLSSSKSLGRSLALFLLTSALVLGAVPLPASGQIATPNLCTLYESSSLTSQVVSTLSEDWDNSSNSWEAETRTIVTYTGDNPTKLLIQERVQSTWRDTLQTQGIYDGSGRLTRCTVEERKQNAFVNSFRIEFAYTGGNEPEMETTQIWDTTDAEPNGAFINASRSNFTRDGNGNVTKRIDEAWDRDSEDWIASTRILNEYDDQNRRTEHRRQTPDGSGGWIDSRRTRNTYGPDGIVESVTETWNLTGSSWDNDSRTQYAYPSATREVATRQDWDGGGWVDEERTTTDLNDDDLTVQETEEDWDGTQWVNSGQSDYSYTTLDGTQKLAEFVDKNWDPGTSDWVNSDRTTYSYDSVIPVELAWFNGVVEGQDVVLQWQTLSESNSAGFSVQHRQNETEVWTEMTFVASKAPGGTTDAAQSYRYVAAALDPGAHDFRLEQIDLDGSATLSERIAVEVPMQRAIQFSGPVPNPVSNVASLSFAVKEPAEARVTVYNILGQLVRTLYRGIPTAGRKHRVRFDTKGLPNGMYFVRLEVGGQTRTERVTVVR